MELKTGNLAVIQQCFQIFPQRARKRLILFFGVQATGSLLDLLGVAILGFIGVLAVRGVESIKQGTRTQSFLRLLGLSHVTFQIQALILGLTATGILILRTLFSVYITRKALHFIGYQSSLLAKDLLGRVLNRPLLSINARSLQETIYSITNGVEKIGFGVIGLAGTIFSDLALLAILFAALLVANFVLAIATFLLFGVTGASLYLLLHRRAAQLGKDDTVLQIDGYKRITEVIGSYRELVLRDRRSFYVENIAENRKRHAQVVAENTFMPNISKYVIEAVLVVSALVLSGLAVATQDAGRALAVLTIFLAASTRISPALLRVQQSLVQIRNNVGVATTTLELFAELQSEAVGGGTQKFSTVHEGFGATVQLENVSFTYPNAEIPAVDKINFKVSPGEVIAIVGSSGAGKSTLIDLLLGIIPPDYGSILIGGKEPLQSYRDWPGSVGYVPQDIQVADTTIRGNLTLGFQDSEVDDNAIAVALQKAQLEVFISTLPEGTKFEVGERGNKLSGGQRQRLGIARALLTSPAILVLDEATSALDSETELAITEALHSLRGETTLIVVAHRLASVRAADKVIYLEAGRIKAQGTFDEVRAQAPDFDRQAKLLGL